MRLEAIINGGGQERGIRSGTLPAPLAVGLGAAARIAREELEADHRWARIQPDSAQRSASMVNTQHVCICCATNSGSLGHSRGSSYANH